MRACSDETKAKIVALVLAGKMAQDIAVEVDVSERTVYNVRKHHLAEICSHKKEQIMVLMLDYLTESLSCLKKQCEYTSEREYIQKQSAADLAILHGVIADKQHKVLSALGAVEAPEPA